MKTIRYILIALALLAFGSSAFAGGPKDASNATAWQEDE